MPLLCFDLSPWCRRGVLAGLQLIFQTTGLPKILQWSVSPCGVHRALLTTLRCSDNGKEFKAGVEKVKLCAAVRVPVYAMLVVCSI